MYVTYNAHGQTDIDVCEYVSMWACERVSVHVFGSALKYMSGKDRIQLALHMC